MGKQIKNLIKEYLKFQESIKNPQSSHKSRSRINHTKSCTTATGSIDRLTRGRPASSNNPQQSQPQTVDAPQLVLDKKRRESMKTAQRRSVISRENAKKSCCS